MKVPVDIWQNGFWLKGDQRKKSEKPIPFDGNSLPEAVPLGSRRKEGVSYPNQVRFAGEISDVFVVPLLRPRPRAINPIFIHCQANFSLKGCVDLTPCR